MKASFYTLAKTILSPIRKERLFSIFLKEFTPNDFLKILSSLCGVWNLYKRVRSSFYILSHFAPMLWRLKNKTEFSLSYQNDGHLRSRVFDCFVSWSFGFSSSNVLIPLLIVVKKKLERVGEAHAEAISFNVSNMYSMFGEKLSGVSKCFSKISVCNSDC